jgi:hypothetical protein
MVDSGDSVPGLPEPGGSDPVVLDGMRVLRLCSVFEPAALSGRSAGYDAIGGMQNHTAELSRHLDRMGARQLILTSRLDGPASRTSTLQMSTFAIRAAMYKYTALVAWPAGL